MGGGEFQVPSLCHLDLLPLSSIFKLYSFTSLLPQVLILFLVIDVIVYIFFILCIL